ncbi:terpenoid cyclases/Protein prenyltransferase [Fistulina hepatica ATCC 64428]|uniref:Terpenoid cyclases/Protein prenyltransferase n=1 Tax=Fistulina hepatica ATCC 64428 TaxID=1128425 RepID=A0A0D7ANR8_9AGAR|nr:terpenoid cyclases/Protein prenyltransferase [Fistulina hepatica ATCC 64428]
MTDELPPLQRVAHAGHVNRCMTALPFSQVEIESSKLALAFYCLGTLDLLGLLESKTTEIDRESWREWIWEQQTHGKYGTGFRPSPAMTPQHDDKEDYTYSDCDTPHIIMTYTALLTLSILHDDFSRLDRPGIALFLSSCQREDGSFGTVPNSSDSDLRTVYCAFAISSMLNDWSGVNVEKAIEYIASCRSYEGGYGQAPFCEAHGGITYTAVASLHLAPIPAPLTPAERRQTIRWLLQNQATSGGFCGRTYKDADACYCFWCGAALRILDAEISATSDPLNAAVRATGLLDPDALARFISSCQFKYGGISKAVGEHPDPYHTYLSLAALSMYPQTHDGHPSWQFEPLDPLLNAREQTARWAREHIPAPDRRSTPLVPSKLRR